MEQGNYGAFHRNEIRGLGCEIKLVEYKIG